MQEEELKEGRVPNSVKMIWTTVGEGEGRKRVAPNIIGATTGIVHIFHERKPEGESTTDRPFFNFGNKKVDEPEVGGQQVRR